MELTSSCTYQAYPHTGPNDPGYCVNIPTSQTHIFPTTQHQTLRNRETCGDSDSDDHSTVIV